LGTKNNPAPNDCYANALPDEPMFTLLGRDPAAPGLIRQWAQLRQCEVIGGMRPASDQAVCDEARRCADAMEAWREANDGAWRKPCAA
jgi:hypothetical protein